MIIIYYVFLTRCAVPRGATQVNPTCCWGASHHVLVYCILVLHVSTGITTLNVTTLAIYCLSTQGFCWKVQLRNASREGTCTAGHRSISWLLDYDVHVVLTNHALIYDLFGLKLRLVMCVDLLLLGTPLRPIFKLRIYNSGIWVKRILKRRRWAFLARRLIS